MMLKPALRPPLRAPMRGATTLREGGGAPPWGFAFVTYRGQPVTYRGQPVIVRIVE